MTKLLVFGKALLKGFFALIILATLIVLFSIPVSRFNTPDLNLTLASPNTLLIENIRLVDIDNNSFVSGQSIFIENGKVAEIGESKTLSRKYSKTAKSRIDAKGKFLLPGLVDAHVHIFDPQDLGLYLSHGITSVRNMAGMPVHLRWQEDALKGQLDGSRLMTYSPALNAGSNIGPFHKRVESADQGKALVRKFAEMGYQGIKVYNGLSKDMLTAILNEAEKLGLPVAGHPSQEIDFKENIKMPMASIEHVEELFQIGLKYKATSASVAELTQIIADSQTPIVSTLVAFDNIHQASLDGPAFKKSVNWEYLTDFTSFVGKKQLSPQFESQNSDWESKKTRAHYAITRSLFEKNAVIAIGSDTGPALTMPGLSFHREIEILDSLEIPKNKILRSATEESSKLLNQKTICGRVKVGCIADLILVNDNPLENLKVLKEPEIVFLEGKHFDRKNLMLLRNKGKSHHSFYVVLGWLLESLFQ